MEYPRPLVDADIYNDNDYLTGDEIDNTNSTSDSYDHTKLVSKAGDFMTGSLSLPTIIFNDNTSQHTAFTNELQSDITVHTNKLNSITYNGTTTNINSLTIDGLTTTNITPNDKQQIYNNTGNITLINNELVVVDNRLLSAEESIISNTTDINNIKPIMTHFTDFSDSFRIYSGTLNKNIFLHSQEGKIQLYSNVLEIGNQYPNTYIKMNQEKQYFCYTNSDRDLLYSHSTDISQNTSAINGITALYSDISNNIANVESINELLSPISQDANNNLLINTPIIVDEIRTKFLYFENHVEYQGQPFKNSHAMQIAINKSGITTNATHITTNSTNIATNNVQYQTDKVLLDIKLTNYEAQIAFLLNEVDLLQQETLYLFNRFKQMDAGIGLPDDTPWYIIRAT